MNVKFYLKADPKWDGALKVREYFESTGGGVRLDPTGKPVPADYTLELVDEGIIKEHQKDYAAFRAAFERDPEFYHQKALENPETLIDVIKLKKGDGDGDAEECVEPEQPIVIPEEPEPTPLPADPEDEAEPEETI